MENSIDLAANLCKKFEGCYLRPYLCPAGIPTIGYGSTHYDSGIKVTLSDAEITKDRALELLMFELERICLPQVKKLLPIDMSDGQLAAMLDFTYNLGAGNLKASTMRKRILNYDWDGAEDELMKWVKGGGKVLKGLVSRRKAECELIKKP